MDTLVGKEELQAFGILKESANLDGLEFQKKLRSEWDELSDTLPTGPTHKKL